MKYQFIKEVCILHVITELLIAIVTIAGDFEKELLPTDLAMKRGTHCFWLCLQKGNKLGSPTKLIQQENFT